MSTDKVRGYAFGALGLVAVVALWWLLKLTVFSDKLIPTPAGVVSGLFDDGFTFYRNNFSGTIEEALRGFAYGNIAALLMASLVLLAPALERVITQIAIISYCIPLVAITPILYVVLGGSEGPGDPSPTAVVLAAVSCFFTTLVGAVLGFRSADTTSLDVVSVYGGSRLAQLHKVQLVSALPAILSALQIAAPAAFLGAVLGEYIGGVDRGVAPALINAAQNLNDERAWGLMLVSGLVAGVGYGFFSLLARFVTPWAKGAAA